MDTSHRPPPPAACPEPDADVGPRPDQASRSPCAELQAPPGLRVDLLHTFIVLAEDLHFTRAANRLFLSQSGLSRRISLLEAILGAPLVVRSTRSVQLTDAGQALLPHATAVVRAADAAARAIRPGSAPAEAPMPATRRTA